MPKRQGPGKTQGILDEGGRFKTRATNTQEKEGSKSKTAGGKKRLIVSKTRSGRRSQKGGVYTPRHKDRLKPQTGGALNMGGGDNWEIKKQKTKLHQKPRGPKKKTKEEV